MALTLTSALQWPYTWSRNLILSFFSGTEKEAVVRQVEHLKAQLQRAQEHSFSQEQRINELSTNLGLETNENKSLWDQIVYLTNELHKERQLRQQQTQMCKKKRAIGYQHYTQKIDLLKQLEDMQRLLAHQKSQEELLVSRGKETWSELEKLTVSYNELHQAYNNLSHEHNEIQQRYATDLKAEKQTNVNLQQQLQTEMQSGADRVSGFEELVHSMKCEQDALRQKMEQETKLLQQATAERDALRMELEDLKIQLHEQTTKNLELVAQLKAEEEEEDEGEEVIQVQLVDELKDLVCQQEFPAVSQDPQLVEEESCAILQEPEFKEEASERGEENLMQC